MKPEEMRNKIDIGRNFMKFNQEEDFLSDQELKKPQPPLAKDSMSDEKIVLPTHFDDLEMMKDIKDIINQRKSSRVFTEEKMTLLQLSYLLWATQGVKEIRGKSYATLRTVPSGGARHAFETYLMVRNCEGLKPGTYHYLPMSHELEYLGHVEEMQSTISSSLCNQEWGAKANVVFYWSFVAYRAEWRYSITAHRVALIDIGHVGENLYLACSALSLGVCGVAAFDQKVCDDLFGLDGEEEFTVYSAPVGCINECNQEAEQAFYAFVKEQGL